MDYFFSHFFHPRINRSNLIRNNENENSIVSMELNYIFNSSTFIPSLSNRTNPWKTLLPSKTSTSIVGKTEQL